MVIYTKPNCMPCKMTTKLMDNLKLPYENTYYGNVLETNSIDIDHPNEEKRNWSYQKIEKIKAKYKITSLPLIKVVSNETEEVLDFWSGFRPDKIKQWSNKK